MRLTDNEWQVLGALWAAKDGVTLGQAVEALRYRAAAERRDCAAQERRSLVERVYEGSAGKFIAAFLREEPLSHQEREELRRLLDEMEV